MCGIAGFFLGREAGADSAALRDTASRMADAIAHRGPDDAGLWLDAASGVALAHRRLSILDLSANGHQPMVSASGRYTIVFNGEIYNFRALRAVLEGGGVRFRGRADTEVLLAAIEEWGLDRALRESNGMFAFALWDADARTLTLARDRVGKKPLYYGWCGGAFAFGSELKALFAIPGFAPDVDRGALALLLRFNYVPTPWSILRGVFKLPAGTSATFDARAVAAGPGAHSPREAAQPFWQPLKRARAALAHPFAGDAEAALDTLDTALRDAVRIRLECDVPLGTFLSGGIDSSLVTALMQQLNASPVRSFSIGFEDPRRDEAPVARAVAQYLGTNHTEFYVTGDDALATVPQLATTFDEPFADSSQIPTLLVSRLARREVTVVLSGDGGDELFAGYNRYVRALRIRRYREQVPRALQALLARAMRAYGGQEPRGHALRQLAAEIVADSPEAIYLNRMSRWRHPERAVPGTEPLATPFTDPAQRLAEGHAADRFMYLDFVTYLPDDILVKVDRATMAVGLEARAPLLDYRIVELAWSLPWQMKLRDGETKWLLRRLLARYVPPGIVARPKQGFGAPVADWLQGPLATWATDLLEPARLRRDGYFDARVVGDLWARFRAGNRKWHTHLWNVLMFQAWLDFARSATSARVR
jgi:asparagine synthase (glutamine-hydrolysing)